MAKKEISHQQKLFCQYYIIDFKGGQAARNAGYSRKSAGVTSTQLLKLPEIQKEIKRLTTKTTNKLKITHERVFEEYARLAFFNPQNMYDEISGDIKTLDELDEDTARAISSFKRTEITSKVLGKIGYEADVKFADKKGALDSISRCMGLFNDKVSIGGQPGNPLTTQNTNTNIDIDLSDLTDEQLDAIEQLNASLTASIDESDSDI